MKKIIALVILVLAHTASASKLDIETNCLAKNIYHEARGESLQGKMAVAIVTINRSNNWRFPNTICKVVYQPGQFTWTQAPVAILEHTAWLDSVFVAQLAREFYTELSIHFPALYFHNTQIRPSWMRSRIRVARIGNHIFYK